jgi:hypothetical protein
MKFQKISFFLFPAVFSSLVACEKAAETEGAEQIVNAASAPSAPTGFTLGTVSSTSVTFTWNDVASNESLYQIDRCTGSGCTSFALLAGSLAADTTTYTDSSVLSGTVYNYRIRALNSYGSNTLSSGDVTTSSTSAAAASCSSPTSLILDYGNKGAGAIATASRGLYTDVKYIPSGVTTNTSAVTGEYNGNLKTISTNVGVAYMDTGSSSIKYSYWNGQSFKSEVIAGDLVANVNNVKLVYLATSTNVGRPLVFWSNGAANNGQIFMAARSTASLTSTTATWTVSVIDTGFTGGATTKALEVIASPDDQVAVSYQAQTGAAIRFIYCQSNCQTASNYVSMPAANRVDTASVAAQRQMGLAWCQHSAGVYSPAVVYGVTATTFTYAACLTYSTTPTNCLSAANWTKSTTPITVGAGSGLVSDLFIDSSILKSTPKILVKNNAASGLITYTLPTCDSFTAASAYTAGSAIATATVANTGNSFAKILKYRNTTGGAPYTSERFFVVYNDNITDMRWAKSSTSTFTGAWLTSTGTASSIHNNAALLAAAGTPTMGADINQTTEQIIAGYGTSIAANFGIYLGVVDGFLTASPATAASNTYAQFTIDSNGAIQLNATQKKNVAIAATSTNQPAVAWIDYSLAAVTTGKLKYALRSSSVASFGYWRPVIVPGASVGTYGPQNVSLAFDNNNKPWIGYWDATLLRFILTTNTESDGSGQWTSYPFPLAGATGHGAPVAQPAENSTAVAMYVSGGVYYPVMIIIDNTATLTKAVKSAKFDMSTGKWGSVTTIDSTLTVKGAAFLSADWNSLGTIAVSYQDLATGAVLVKYAASTDGGATWPTNGSAPFGVSGLAQGEGITLKLNPSTHLPSISYYDRANNKLFFASCTANCTGTGIPTFTGTSNGEAVTSGTGISGLSALGNVNLLNAALTFSASGDAYIVYNTGALDAGALKLVNNVGGTMPSGLATTLVAGKNGTINTAATAATNFGVPWGQDAVRLSNGALATAYIAPGNFLGVTTCGD